MKLKSLICAAAALAMAAALAAPAYAAPADHPHQPGQAIVSEEVTQADITNPSGTNTEFFLFIENPVTDFGVPKTGDSGPDMNALVLAALGAGAGYLACTYAQRKA